VQAGASAGTACGVAVCAAAAPFHAISAKKAANMCLAIQIPAAL
jgi:hypothetical protein